MIDIRNWPLDKIMQLPDWVFGAKFYNGHFGNQVGGGSTYYKFPTPLPDRIVLWDIIGSVAPETGVTYVLAGWGLGSEVPTAATWRRGDRLLANFVQINEAFDISMPVGNIMHLGPVRLPIVTGKRHITANYSSQGGNEPEIHVTAVISAIPNEIPDICKNLV